LRQQPAKARPEPFSRVWPIAADRVTLARLRLKLQRRQQVLLPFAT